MDRVLSPLLTIRENGLLRNLLGLECTASAFAVVQLYMATASQRSEWKLHCCGVGSLVQDRKLHAMFIRIFSVKRAKLLWEQELYMPFRYKNPCPYFHTLHTDNCWAGLNFADEDEASRFYSAVQKCISSTKVHPVFIRTHSLDSASARQLRSKLDKCLLVSQNKGQAAIKHTPTNDPEETSKTVETEASALSSIPTSKPCSISSTEVATLSLGQRKGPLPPIPSYAQKAKSDLVPTIDMDEIHVYNPYMPCPPPFPAPKLFMTSEGIKKSSSFSPGGNHYAAVLKHQRSLDLSDVSDDTLQLINDIYTD